MAEVEGGGVTGERFDLLFIVCMLGTFLAPTASTKVAKKLLKVAIYTKNRVREFDWATFIVKELHREVGEYVTAYRNNKEGRSFVGGCLYFLLVCIFGVFDLKLCENIVIQNFFD